MGLAIRKICVPLACEAAPLNKIAASRSYAPPRVRADTSHRCLFLEIPPEIRLYIYELLLSPEELAILSLQSSTDEIRTTYLPINNPAGQKFKAFVRGRRLRPQLLATCSQVYYEAKSTLYRPSKLRFHTSSQNLPTDSPSQKLKGFDIRELGSLTKLTSLHVEIFAPPKLLQQQEAHCAALLQYLRKRLAAKQFLMVIRIPLGCKEPKNEVQGLCQSTVIRVAPPFGHKLRVDGVGVAYSCGPTVAGTCRRAGEKWFKRFDGQGKEPDSDMAKDMISSIRLSDDRLPIGGGCEA